MKVARKTVRRDGNRKRRRIGQVPRLCPQNKFLHCPPNHRLNMSALLRSINRSEWTKGGKSTAKVARKG